MCPFETKWLEKAMQDIIDTQSIVVKPNLWHVCDGEGGELMLSLVICDGVHALHGDILLKRTLSSIVSGCISMVTPSKLSANMCMVFLGAAEPAPHWCIVSVLIFKCVLVVMRINLSKYMFRFSWTCFSYCSWCCCLMSLSTNNLMSLWVGKLIDTWSNASPGVL